MLGGCKVLRMLDYQHLCNWWSICFKSKGQVGWSSTIENLEVYIFWLPRDLSPRSSSRTYLLLLLFYWRKLFSETIFFLLFFYKPSPCHHNEGKKYLSLLGIISKRCELTGLPPRISKISTQLNEKHQLQLWLSILH